MKVGIIGGGIMGMCLGYYLSQNGASVEIFEAASCADDPRRWNAG